MDLPTHSSEGTPESPPQDGYEDDERRYALIRSIESAEGAQDFYNAMSTELLLQDACDWGALLSHAPRALCSMGQCFVVASTPMASSISLVESSDLKYKGLRSNMVHCSDLGRNAFRQAENKMLKVTMYTQYICEPGGTIEKILQSLEDEALTKHDLPAHLEKLKKFAKECVTDAEDVQREFASWQKKAEEIRLACTEEDYLASDAERKLATESNELSMQKESLAKDVERLQVQEEAEKGEVQFHREQYVLASKPLYPSGWEGHLQRWIGTVVEGAGQAAQVGASVLATTFAMTKNPLANAAAPLVKNALAPQSVEKEPCTRGTENASDIAFEIASSVTPLLRRLVEAIGEKSSGQGDLGMDWPTISGQRDPQFSVGAFKSTMCRCVDNPELINSKSDASYAAKDTLHQVIDIAKVMDDWVQREQTVSGPGLNALSVEVVQGWRRELKSGLKNFAGLSERQKVAEREQKAYVDKTKKKRSKHNRFTHLSQYRENYAASQKILLDAENRLRERSERERRAKEQFEAIQSQLESLQDGKTTRAEVRMILGACMRNLATLQEHLSELVTFFQRLHVFIDTTYQTRGEEFIRVASGMNNLLLEKSPEERAGFKAERLGLLKAESLTLRGYYAVMREISSTYCEVSKKFIMPGVNQVDRLSVTEDSDSAGEFGQAQIRDKVAQISMYAEGAQKKIGELAERRKQALVNQLQKRRGEAEELGYMIEQAEKNAEAEAADLEDRDDGPSFAI